MKRIFTLSVFLLAGMIAQAQVSITSAKEQQAIIVGPGILTDDVRDGLLCAWLAAGPNQIALVAGQAFTSTYFAIQTADGRTIAGSFKKRYAGQYDIIDLGCRPGKPKIVFSDRPLIAHASTSAK